MTKPGNLINWLPALLWALLIFFQSANPSPPGAGLAPDYLLHFAAFGILGSFLALGFAGGIKGLYSGSFNRLQAVFSVMLALLYGLTDEFHQSFVPGRNPSWTDVAADFLGALVFVTVLLIWNIAAGNRKDF